MFRSVVPSRVRPTWRVSRAAGLWIRTLATTPDVIKVNRIAGSLGAEVLGVDLRTIDNDKAKEIRRALLDHKVIFFRDQTLTPNEFLNFSSYFGRPVEYPFVKG